MDMAENNSELDASVPQARVGELPPDWRSQFALHYVSQGVRPGTKRTSNDCGPANVAMMLDYWRKREGLDVPAPGLAAALKTMLPVIDRVPVVLPQVKIPTEWLGSKNIFHRLAVAYQKLAQRNMESSGGTGPWAVAGTFNRLVLRMGADVRASWRNKCTFEDLISALQRGFPLTVMLIWPEEWGSGGHWVTVVGCDTQSGKVAYLDPDPALAEVPLEQKLKLVEKEWFEKYWGGRNWWARLLNQHNVMVTYKQKASD